MLLFSDWGNTMSFGNSVFTGNSAGFGAGVCVSGETDATFASCVFAGNVAATSGGAIYNQHDSKVTNCTFAGNEAGTSGGAIFSEHLFTVNVANSILWGNGPEEISSQNAITTVTYSDVQGGHSGAGNTSADPLFAGYPAQTGNTWTAVAYDAATFQTVLTDSTASWTPASLTGLFVKPTQQTTRASRTSPRTRRPRCAYGAM